ncbi:MAG: glycosyltransferase family 2 protein [Phycisphaerae bacterium]|jgi:dolichol-phosphate mannosyltransferase|nr:glycosyltransferase family 2 protein [Phycisphaerae bacterium]
MENSISIIIPTYKEAQNLPDLIESIDSVMRSTTRVYEVLIVDDDSRDGSDKIIADFSARGYPVRMILRANERGLSSAVVRGFLEAKGDILICMDADLSHPPEALPRLIQAIESPGVDFGIASRYITGGGTDEKWGFFRWLNSKGATLLARPLTKVKDPMSGFFGLLKSTFNRRDPLNPIGYKIGLELLIKCRCKNIREIPIHFTDRRFGQSKLNLKEQLNYLKHIKRLADYKFGLVSRFFQFCAVGGTGMVVDLCFYSLFLFWTMPIPIARALAIIVAMTWNFNINRRLTFSHSRYGNIFTQYLRFSSSCAAGALISWLVAMSLAKSPFFSQHLLLAAVMGIMAGTGFNFLLSFKWVFSIKGQNEKVN